MIYLLIDVYLKDISDLSSVERVLKIGYSSGSFIAKRKPAYDTHNFGYAFVIEIEGTEDDEKQMHIDFKDLCVGGEWFKYDSRILQRFGVEEDNLQSISTQKGCRKAGVGRRLNVTTSKRIIKRFINRWLCIDSSEDRDSFSDKYNSAIELQKTLCPDTQEKLISGLFEHFKIQNAEIITDIRDFLDGKLLNSDHVKEILSQFKSLSTFIDKMRLVCTEKMTDEERQAVFSQIPVEFKNYYIILGPDKIKALGYQGSRCEREYNRFLSNQDIDLESQVYSMFEVGKRYKLSDIKSSLKELYTMVGYKSAAKANDLENWFEIRRCKVPSDKDGKRDEGFEIISRRDENKDSKET